MIIHHSRKKRAVFAFLLFPLISIAITALFVSSTFATTTITTVDGTNGNAGLYISLALNNQDSPVMSYFDWSNDGLKLTTCANPTCSILSSSRVVDSSWPNGGYTSLVLNQQGFPIISYHDAFTGSLKLVACNDTTCSNPQPIVLDTNDAGWYPSIVLDGGKPVISYLDHTNRDLKLGRCTDATCCSGTAPCFTSNRVDSVGDVGWCPSLVRNITGTLFISYYDRTNESSTGNLVKLAKCDDSTGNCSSTTVDTIGGQFGECTSLALNQQGLPVISYYASGDMKLAMCSDEACANKTLITIDSAGDVGQYSSLAINQQNYPVISYYDVTNGDLKLVACGDASCTASHITLIGDTTSDVGKYSALVINSQNNPIISYYDSTQGDLKLAACDNPTCSLLPEIDLQGNNIPIPNGDTTPLTTDGTDFGSVNVGNTFTNTFTILNIGANILNLTGVSLSGTGCDPFSIIPPTSLNIDINESSAFQVTFTPTSEGTFNCTVNIDNNDSNENPYTFALTGKRQSTQPIPTPPPPQPLPPTMNLTINFGGTGHGHVTIDPSGIDCDSNQAKCSHSVDTASWINLIPTAAAGSQFTGWSGFQSDCDNGELFMSGSRSCTANFKLLPHQLTVNVLGQGKVSSNPTGIACDSNCGHQFKDGEKVVLTAVPAAEWSFKEWQGDCDQIGQVVMDKDKKCQALFVVSNPLTVNVDINTFTVEVESVATFKGYLVEDKTISKVNWDFGDGTSADTLATTHVYNSVGNYPVTLTITADQGETGKKTVQIEVVPAETIPEHLDTRIAKAVSVAPQATQLAAEQLLWKQFNDSLVTTEYPIADSVNTHFNLLGLNQPTREILAEVIYSPTPGATLRLLGTSNLRSKSSSDQTLLESVAPLIVTYNNTKGVLSSIYNATDYLTKPSATNPQQVALDYLNVHLDLLGVQPPELANMKLIDTVYSKVTNTNHFYWQQFYQELPLYNTQLQVNVNREGQIISVNNDFIPHVAAALLDNAIQPTLTAGEAVKSAMQHLGVHLDVPPAEIQPPAGIRQETIIDNTHIALEPIKVSLMWLPLSATETRLVWNLLIHTLDERHVYDMNVDAASGEVLTRFDQVDEDSYRVYPRPVESPQHTVPLPPADARAIVFSPAYLTASPFRWHDTNGILGAEFTLTRGNNVYAHKLSTPDTNCGAGLNCIFPIDLTQPPSTYVNASVTNLFYWNNIIHDVMFEYGFDSPGGNFQVNTYGAGGLGGDAVDARAQISTLCNAFFGTPPDGLSPTMSMYICGGREGTLDSGVVIHEYGHGISNRLIGGPSNVSCLENKQRAGEGISDWLALVFTHQLGDTGAKKRGLGSYLFGLPPDGTIRPQSYSTNPAINTYTYQSINGLAIPHGVGSVWAQAAWEVYWALVDTYGFSPNLYNASGNSGNQRMLLYVTEGLKNTKCNPTFTDIRDGIIQAAKDNHAGQDVCLIWQAFAHFGLGIDAVSGGPNSTTPTNDFKVPQGCMCTSPTVKSVNSGRWFANAATVWSTGVAPGANDRVLIQSHHQVTADNTININQLCIESTGKLQADQSWFWLPKPLIVNALATGTLWGEIYNRGKIIGRNGPAASFFWKDGKAGGNVELQTDNFTNIGEIIAGRGGDDISYTDNSSAKGGKGGGIFVQANRQLVNYGKIGPASMHKKKIKTHYNLCIGGDSDYYQYVFDNLINTSVGGNGGHGKKWNGVFSDEGTMKGSIGDAFGGQGGNTIVRGLHIANYGRIAAGYGGDAYRYDCISNVQAGLGGDAKIIPLPGGTVMGLAEIDGGKGNVWIEPSILMGGQDVHVYNSNNVTIFGGNESTLILTNLRNEAISATDTLTLAVGQKGTVDLRGNTGKVLKAGNRVKIFADEILLDPGMNLPDLIDTPTIETYPSKILYHVTLHAPKEVGGNASEVLPINLKLDNGGPTQDTYTLMVTDSAGWSLGSLPSPITVEGLQLTELQLNVTLPNTLDAQNTITITATSLTDPTVSTTTEITVTVVDPTSLPPPDESFSGTVYDQSGTPVAGAILRVGDEMLTTDENGYWQLDNPTLISGTLHDAQGNPLVGATIQLGEQTLTTDANGYWELAEPLVTGSDSQNIPATDPVSSLSPATPSCYASGLVDWVCNANGQQLTDLTVGPNGMIASGTLVGTLTNQGWVSNLTLEPHSRLTGGIITGYITNHGEIANFEFRGAAIVGGTLAGEITNTSQAGGYFRDVQLAAGTHLSGGQLAGKISGEAQAPALLENLEIQAGSHLEQVTIGESVKLAADVTWGEGVQFNDPSDDPRLVIKQLLQPEACDTGLPSLGVTATNATGQVIDTQCQCAGGVSINSGSFESTVKVRLTDRVEIRGTVCVAPEQLGQLADLVVYLDYQPLEAAAEEKQHYMLDSKGEVLPWDGDPAHLVAFQQTMLAAVQEVLLYQGQLATTGKLNLFFGYRLLDGTRVSNDQAIEITVTD